MLVSASAAPRGKALIGRISLGNGRRGRAAEGIGIGAGGLGAGVFAILDWDQGFGELDDRRGLGSSWTAVPNERGGLTRAKSVGVQSWRASVEKDLVVVEERRAVVEGQRMTVGGGGGGMSAGVRELGGGGGQQGGSGGCNSSSSKY